MCCAVVGIGMDERKVLMVGNAAMMGNEMAVGSDAAVESGKIMTSKSVPCYN